MGKSGHNGLCEEAREHLYDFLMDASHSQVPGPIADHIRDCPLCLDQARRLEAALAGVDEVPGDVKNGTEVVETLSRHFEHVDQRLTCTHVKPYIPELLVPGREIHIPTPVTVHLNHCHACAADLERLRMLGPRAQQLERLVELFVAEPPADFSACLAARPTAMAFASFSLEGQDVDAVRHVCLCPRCRQWVYQKRGETVGEDLDRAGATGILCERVSASDIFDCVLPVAYTDPAGPRPDETLLAHVRSCPSCIQRIQTVHQIVYGIAERADSGVSTIYHARAPQRTGGQEPGLYEGYPIDVEVIGAEWEPANRTRPSATRPVAAAAGTGRRAKSAFGVVFAAAAVLIVVLLADMPFTSGLNADQIDRAVARVPNVHVTTFGPQGTAIHEMWVSHAWEAIVMRRGAEWSLLDLKDDLRTIVNPEFEFLELTRLAANERADLQRTMLRYLTISDESVPTGAVLQPLASDVTGPSLEGVEVYELTWESTGPGGRTRYYRSIVHLNAETRLPVRTELSRRSSAQDPWELGITKQFEYISDTRAREVIDRVISLAEQGATWAPRGDSGSHTVPKLLSLRATYQLVAALCDRLQTQY